MGALVVKNGRIVGRGFHRKWGLPHAEIEALRAAAKAREADVVIVDTAGRLQTKKNLMDEVAKIVWVVGKVVEGATHEVLLVLEAAAFADALLG